MSLISLAGKCGVTSSSLARLIAGNVTVAVSGRLGVTSSSLQAFVDGGTSLSLAGKMGITSASLQELRNGIGKEGAIGLIIAFMHEGFDK